MKLNASTMLRWPDGLRQAVVDAARRNRRSMNSEILTRLESSFAEARVITNGNLLPCPCGAGQPFETWAAKDDAVDYIVSCPCGQSVKAADPVVAALRWNVQARASQGRDVA